MSANLRSDLKEAYGATLSKHHTFFVRQAVAAAALTLGTKSSFLSAVAGSSEEGQGIISGISLLIKPTVDTMYGVLNEKGIKDVA